MNNKVYPRTLCLLMQYQCCNTNILTDKNVVADLFLHKWRTLLAKGLSKYVWWVFGILRFGQWLTRFVLVQPNTILFPKSVFLRINIIYCMLCLIAYLLRIEICKQPLITKYIQYIFS